MSKRKYSYHVICECSYESLSGKHLPILRCGDIEVSYNGIIDSDVSIKDTAFVIEYRMCSNRDLFSAIPRFIRDRLLFKLTIFPRGRKSSRSSFVTYFPYRFIAD